MGFSMAGVVVVVVVVFDGKGGLKPTFSTPHGIWMELSGRWCRL